MCCLSVCLSVHLFIYGTADRISTETGEHIIIIIIIIIQIGRSLVRSQLVSVEIFIDLKSFRSHYGPGVDSASNRNE